MVFRYDRTRDAVVDDVTGAAVRAEGRPGQERHSRYASYELKGHVLQVPYYYFNKDVLDKTDHGLRKTGRPFKAIIPKSRVNFNEFSSFFFKLYGMKPSDAQYVAFLEQMKEGIIAGFRRNGEWDEFLQPFEADIMNWQEAQSYAEMYDQD